MNSTQVRLEMKITEVERLVSDLNEVVYEQQKMIDALRAQLKHLESRLEQGASGGDLPHVRPPHY